MTVDAMKNRDRLRRRINALPPSQRAHVHAELDRRALAYWKALERFGAAEAARVETFETCVVRLLDEQR